VSYCVIPTPACFAGIQPLDYRAAFSVSYYHGAPHTVKTCDLSVGIRVPEVRVDNGPLFIVSWFHDEKNRYMGHEVSVLQCDTTNTTCVDCAEWAD